MTVRGIRGATTADANTREAILDATRELLAAIVDANELRVDDIASVYFTMTPDLDAAFPARSTRDMGWNDLFRVIAYFKDMADRLLLEKYCKEHDIPKFPLAIAHTDICRSDLLFEIEVDAMQ